VRSNFHRPTNLGIAISAIAVALALPAGLRADEPAKDEAPVLSEEIGDGLAKVEPMVTAKDWLGAMTLVNGLLEKAAPGSYDQAFLNEMKAQILTQKGDYPSAIDPLETALTIADQHHYFSNKQETDMLYFLSQLYYQKADTLKSDHEAELAAYGKAITFVQRWFQITTKPNEDVSLYYAQVLYAASLARDPNHPDPALLRQTREQIEKTLLQSVHPKDSIYTFLLATLQQELDYARAAEYFELILARNPNNKGYWVDLSTLYMALAQDPKDKDEAKIRRYNIRAIDTFERAQALGFMKTPRDNFTLFTLYYNIGQYGIASDLLYNGLETGSIEPVLNNWLLLAASYQQINKDFTAIEVLKKAAARFPKNGELEFKIAQAYQQLDNNQEAFNHAQIATEKGGLSKAQQTYMFLAYTAYEVGKFDEAKVAIDQAIHLMSKPDHQALGLQSAIEEAIKERDAKKAPAAPAPDKI
jgi:tetratricopeptide (TPR) repeat protein